MANKMGKHITVFLIVFFTSFQVWADCGDSPAAKQKGGTEYSHAKTVFHSIDGKMKGNDSLVVWNKNPKNMCFFITTISNEYRTCFLNGKASKVGKDEFSYTQNQCRVSFTFLKDKVKVSVTGSDGRDYCAGADFGEDNGCGMNTSIDSAEYIKESKSLP